MVILRKVNIDMDKVKDSVFSIKWDASMIDSVTDAALHYPKNSKLEYSSVCLQTELKKEKIDFEYLSNQLNMVVDHVTVIRQPPCRFSPLHTDGKLLTHPRRNVRAVIFLKDWVFGQFFGYNNFIMEPWVAGEGILWDGTVQHVAANAAKVDKLTLIVSGLDTHG